ncbi:MAG: adenylate cyclase [Candidatus Sumerlaeia bacterium]|nr:adenylate cyclase [Candidatus Sumerlaeia bacterium]
MNHFEQEWRFLVTRCPRIRSVVGLPIQQAYLSESGTTVRARTYGDRGFLTIKLPGTVEGNAPIIRKEFEYEIPHQDALELIQSSPCKIVKTRYTFASGLEVDFFHDRYEGLIIAEFEIRAEEFMHHPPEAPNGVEWVNITQDPRYSNRSLCYGALPEGTPSCHVREDLHW